jgi:hypothetical protein
MARQGKGKVVRFAPGPLNTDDGHPTHEGKVAQAVPQRSPQTLSKVTKKSIQMIAEELLQDGCEPSLLRLQRRVGLMPLKPRIKPPGE